MDKFAALLRAYDEATEEWCNVYESPTISTDLPVAEEKRLKARDEMIQFVESLFLPEKPHGTSGGVELTDESIEQLSSEAEKGYDPTTLKSIEELARQQGIKPITDPSELVIGDLTDEEAEAFVSALDEAKRDGGIKFFPEATVYTTTKFQGQDVYYEPFIDMDTGRVGYAVRTNPDNSDRVNEPIDVLETFIYFNVSDADSENEPNVFVYIGGDNDPAADEPQHWYAFDFNEEGGIGRDGEAGELTLLQERARQLRLAISRLMSGETIHNMSTALALAQQRIEKLEKAARPLAERCQNQQLVTWQDEARWVECGECPACKLRAILEPKRTLGDALQDADPDGEQAPS